MTGDGTTSGGATGGGITGGGTTGGSTNGGSTTDGGTTGGGAEGGSNGVASGFGGRCSCCDIGESSMRFAGIGYNLLFSSPPGICSLS